MATIINYPRSITHIGVTVTDIDKAINWYTRVLGFNLYFGPVDAANDDSHFGKLSADVLSPKFGVSGPEFRQVRIALMSTGGQTGLELFEFIKPQSERRENNFEYWKNSYHHICILDPDVEALAQSIVENGGNQRTQVWEIFEGSGYKLVFCEDPFGNIIEIYSHSTEQVYSNQIK